MQLTDFYSTLNGVNILIFIFVLFVSDVIGFNIYSLVSMPKYLRCVSWVFGLQIFVFIWFILHFFIPFSSIYIWISLFILSLIFLPFYIMKKGIFSLLVCIKEFPYPFLFILIAAKPLYFLINAPPYLTDELAYHLYSPSKLALETRWAFLSGGNLSLYDMIPKFLNTSYILLFSISKTYISARLLHLLIVLTATASIGAFLKKNISLFAGILYSFFLLFQSALYLSSATWGYVDAGTAIFINLSVIVAVDFIANRKINLLYSFISVASVALSMKYSSVTFIFSSILVGIVVLFISSYKNLTEHIHTLNKINIAKSIVISGGLFTLFGGYWYLKNFILTGNPVYPFFFPCKGSLSCGTGASFFAGWTVPFTLSHSIQILNILFQNNLASVLVMVFAFGIVFCISLFTKKKKVFNLAFFIFVVVLIEVLISSRFSGFELRYYYHWLLLIPLILVLPLFFKHLSQLSLITLISIYLLVFFLTEGSTVVKNIYRIYEPDFVPGNVRNYSAGRMSLNQWIEALNPETNSVIQYCGKKKQTEPIVVIDPALLWSNYEMNAYLVNCTVIIENVYGRQSVQDAVRLIKLKYNNFLLASVTKCTDNKPNLFLLDPKIILRHKLNQALICNATQVAKNLYKIN